MKFTDSHCHLDFNEFSDRLPQLLNQCAQNNIHQIIVPSISPENWSTVMKLALAKNDLTQALCKIYPCLGTHPWYLKQLDNNDLTALTKKIAQHRANIIAIGETGIDMPIAKKYNNLAQQQTFFQRHLQLAQQYQLPVIIHDRQAHHQIVPLLKKIQLTSKGVIHAFSGSYQQAKAYLDLGFYLGVGGTITYPRAKKTIATIKRVPLDRLILETDAPSMPLFGHQGQDNSPLKLIDVFDTLVQIREESAEQIAQQIENNINTLFAFR